MLGGGLQLGMLVVLKAVGRLPAEIGEPKGDTTRNTDVIK